MVNPRVKGSALALSFGGTDFWADATSVVLDNEEASSDVTTFADAAAGGARQEFFTITAIQSTATGSFWSYVHANSGATVAFRYAPHGNAVATADEPHVLGMVKIGPKPALGGEAGKTTEYTFETRFDVVGATTLDRGASAAPLISAITEGREAGETAVVSGSRFSGTTSVKFNNVEVPFVVVSDMTLSVTVGASGPVVVTTPAGASAPFGYQPVVE